MVTYLTRDDIFKANDIATEEVAVPEWGGVVVVKALSGTERDAFEASVVDQRNGKTNYKLENIRAKLRVKTVVDPKTLEPIFTVADIEGLGKKSAAALDRIFSVAQKLSRLTDKDVEELEKN